ncbi:MAG: hypothetical protein OSJ55_01815 [Bacteroidales bacterium]|nr:hypothetical protein [Bacteroidales bacterium]
MIVIDTYAKIHSKFAKDEAKCVKFNSSGKLNTRRLNKSDSRSENMVALKALANSTIEYNFRTSSGYMNANGEHQEFKRGGSWENGITLIPGAESDQSPDDNVYIITNSLLSPEGQATNTAYEAYGYAYFYELKQQGKDVNPFHKYKFVNGEEVWEPLTESLITVSSWVDTNIQLYDQIKKVEEQARYNYNSRLR